jgi:hypothetical protein
VQRVEGQPAWWDAEPISLGDGPDNEAELEDTIPAALAGALLAITEDDDDGVASPATGADTDNGRGIALDAAEDMVRLIHSCCRVSSVYLSTCDMLSCAAVRCAHPTRVPAIPLYLLSCSLLLH